jgi:RNase P subunit RPR2
MGLLGDPWEDDQFGGTRLGASVRDRSQSIQREVSARMPAKEGYCVKCKAKKDIKEPQDITMKNGRPATQGTCPDCGTKIFKIGKS